ncbi:tRNA nucleotidyltransferase (CCA-adding enzyme) [[Eubacterium] yurii]|jgi:tRNA adenylyltransferase|nr:tRNA nucleotidyltransferase (CCA-adding enzyme) [[Eubacterium] yurii]
MKIEIDKKAQKVISMLENKGYNAYIVGGCLRDILLGRKSQDIDITTDALPKEIIDVFKDSYKVIETGVKYGTVTVIIEASPIEITTFRSEQDYVDGRRPEKVSFEKDIKADLSRRDFTVNAMAYNDKDGLIDLFDAKRDLEDKIIRCVGNPRQRFKEDKLRMLRAVRFATTLDFKIEDETFKAIKEYSQYLNEISIERINVELSKMLLVQKPSKAMLLLKKTGLLKNILPVIDDMYGFSQQNPYHEKDLFFHTMDVLDSVRDDLVLRLAALFHDSGKLYTKTVDENNIGHFYGHSELSFEIARDNLRRLRYSNNTIELVALLCKKHMIDTRNITKKGIRKLISLFGKENICYLIELQRADSASTTLGGDDTLKNKVDEVLAEEDIFSLKDMDIDGNDVKNLGYKGKEIGDILKYLFDKVMENPKINEKTILLEIIKREIADKI